MTLTLAPDLKLPAEAATQTFLVVGKRGSGKSNTAVRPAVLIWRVIYAEGARSLAPVASSPATPTPEWRVRHEGATERGLRTWSIERVTGGQIDAITLCHALASLTTPAPGEGDEGGRDGAADAEIQRAVDKQWEIALDRSNIAPETWRAVMREVRAIRQRAAATPRSAASAPTGSAPTRGAEEP